VVSTRVGYTGGSLPNPTYHRLGDHSETIEITYDPSKISYQDLLEVYWWNAPVNVPAWSTQYKSIIFYHDEEQKRLAGETRDELELQYGKDIFVEIIPAGEFYPAEDYHQKYYLQQNSRLMKELNSIYPDFRDIISSTAAARLNGYAGGFGTPESLEELDSLGLSPEGNQEVRKLAEKGLAPARPAAS
jgi:peptide-methionine (S)-S-oxide reductase